MATATLERTDVLARLKELAFDKASGENVDNIELQELLDLARIDRHKWLDTVDKLRVRLKASEYLEQQRSEPDRFAELDHPEITTERESLRTRCEAERDEYLAQVEELQQKALAAMAPLEKLDRRLSALANSLIAEERAAADLTRRYTEILESTADPATESQLTELQVEKQRIQIGLATIKPPKISRADAQAAIKQVSLNKKHHEQTGGKFSPMKPPANAADGIANPGRIIWLHDQYDSERSELERQLSDVSRRIETLTAAKLDWRNVAIG